MILSIFLLLFGLFLLVKGADILVEGAVSIAERFGVSKLFIGLSLVAFGTSAPELAVSITSALKGVGGIAISNVVGSNIANIGLCLGISAIMGRLSVSKSTVKLELPFLLIVSLSFSAMLLRSDPPTIVWNDGVVLLGFMVIYSYYLYRMAKSDMDVLERTKNINLKMAVIFVILGFIGVSFGGDLTVNSIVKIARELGLSNSLFALTVVAVGTSLPELVTSASAVKKGHSDLSVGNIIGSNIMNILAIIGISSLVGGKLSVDVPMYTVDLSFLVGSVVILILFSATRFRLEKVEGLVLLGLYVPYVIFIISRG